MYSTVTFEGNLAADVEVKENKAGGVYVDAVVLVNQGKDSNGDDRTPTRWQESALVGKPTVWRSRASGSRPRVARPVGRRARSRGCRYS